MRSLVISTLLSLSLADSQSNPWYFNFACVTNSTLDNPRTDAVCGQVSFFSKVHVEVLPKYNISGLFGDWCLSLPDTQTSFDIKDLMDSCHDVGADTACGLHLDTTRGARSGPDPSPDCDHSYTVFDTEE